MMNTVSAPSHRSKLFLNLGFASSAAIVLTLTSTMMAKAMSADDVGSRPAITQTESVNSSITQTAPKLAQCNWAIVQSPNQSTFSNKVNLQALSQEAEILLAKLQDPVQLALPSQSFSTELDIAIGGDVPTIEECWRSF